jgi:hypothetical protein
VAALARPPARRRPARPLGRRRDAAPGPPARRPAAGRRGGGGATCHRHPHRARPDARVRRRGRTGRPRGRGAARARGALPRQPLGQALERFVAAAPEHGRAYETWLARTALDSVTDSEVTVVAEDAFTAEWIAQKYRDPLIALLSAVAGRPVALTVRADGAGRPGARGRDAAAGQQADLFAPNAPAD